MDAPVRYSILGTVRAVRGDAELKLGPPKRIALLALLLLRAPGPLTLSEAVDILWDDEPPPSAVNVVHRHIGILRRTLEPGLRSRTKAEHLVRASDGYRLLVDTADLDLLRFRELRARAQRAVRAGEPAKGAQDFVEALRLWRGPTAAAGTHVAQHPLFTSVGHEFVATAKEATDVALCAAPALTEDVLTALRLAVECHPFDEAVHSRIIAALAATGRQAEALQQFESIRRTLADELGVEPGPGLRSARQHLLRRQTAAEPAVLAPRAAETPRPAQLPSTQVPFAGRRQAIRRCLELLAQDTERRPPTTTVAVSGMAGVGKTTLAVQLAHLVAERFPDGQIYVDLQGCHASLPPLDPRTAMCQVLGALDPGRAGPGAGSTAGTALGPALGPALGSVYRSALVGRRLLIVLDDALDCEQVRPLLPGGAGSLAVVTSRRRLEGLSVTDNAHVVPLDPLTPQEGLELLELRLGADRVRGEAGAREIVDLCGGLPLALAVAAARALTYPDFPLGLLARQLREQRDGLAAFAGHDVRTDLRSVFGRSYGALSEGAAQLFRLLGVHPSPDITLTAAVGLAGTEPWATREHLAELVDHHLVTEHAPGRYACHDLLRIFAARMSEAVDACGGR